MHYKETVKRISEKSMDLEQQLRNAVISGEKTVIGARDQVQR